MATRMDRRQLNHEGAGGPSEVDGAAEGREVKGGQHSPEESRKGSGLSRDGEASRRRTAACLHGWLRCGMDGRPRGQIAHRGAIGLCDRAVCVCVCPARPLSLQALLMHQQRKLRADRSQTGNRTAVLRGALLSQSRSIATVTVTYPIRLLTTHLALSAAKQCMPLMKRRRPSSEL